MFRMASALPVLRIALEDADRITHAQSALAPLFGDRVEMIIGGAAGGVSLQPIERLPEAPGEERVVAIGDADLPTLIGLLRARPWVDHVVSPRLLGGVGGRIVAAAVWKLLMRGHHLELSHFLGQPLPAQNARIADSAQREQHLDAITERAQQAGAPPLVVERIRDVAEETITNALYNAPAEAGGRSSTPRHERVQLDDDSACTVSYGVADKLFILRVRDRFGSLSRERLCEVLGRCTTGDVALDTSRGGAGLGMWRVFNAASVVVVLVEPGLSTEFVVGIDLTRRSGPAGARAIHLFFESDRDCEGGEVCR
jgi:hypothetical protein